MATINITLMAGGGTPPLTLQAGDQVNFEALPAGDTYIWELGDKPVLSPDVLLNPTAQNAQLTVSVPGTYLVQVLIDEVDVHRAVVAVPYVVPAPWSTLRAPAIGELLEAGADGWGDVLRKVVQMTAELMTFVDLGIVSGAYTISFGSHSRVYLEANGNLDLEFTGMKPGQTYHLTIAQDAVGSRLVNSWSNGQTVLATGATAPTLTTTALAVDHFSLYMLPDNSGAVLQTVLDNKAIT